MAYISSVCWTKRTKDCSFFFVCMSPLDPEYPPHLYISISSYSEDMCIKYIILLNTLHLRSTAPPSFSTASSRNKRPIFNPRNPYSVWLQPHKEDNNNNSSKSFAQFFFSTWTCTAWSVSMYEPDITDSQLPSTRRYVSTLYPAPPPSMQHCTTRTCLYQPPLHSSSPILCNFGFVRRVLRRYASKKSPGI